LRLEEDLFAIVAVEIGKQAAARETLEVPTRSEVLNIAWTAHSKANELWCAGKQNESRQMWLSNAWNYSNTDAGFASLINLGVTLHRQGCQREAALAFTAVLLLPTPNQQCSFIGYIDELQHNACLALSDIYLQQQNYSSSIEILTLAARCFQPDSRCGVCFASGIYRVEHRISTIEGALRSKTRVAIDFQFDIR
jgi:hypothetical protein